MKMNSTNMMFLMTMTFATMLILSSNNWFSSWFGLEMNMISFLPLMHSKMNYYSSESSMKYFIIQSMGSSILMLGIINSLIMNNKLGLLLMLSGMMIKLGMAPFHSWMPGVTEGLSWMNCLILLTWQKVGLLMMMSYLTEKKMMMLPIILSLLIGSIGGINQTSLKKILSYSSINSLGWLTMSMTISMFTWIIYFTMYSLMIMTLIMIFINFEMNYLNQCLMSNFSMMNKFMLMTTLLSMGGLPPFLGFLPKWIVIQSIMESKDILIMLMMIFTSLITLFYYMRISSMMILFNSTKTKWMKTKLENMKIIYYLSFMNTFGYLIMIILKSL